MVGKVEHVNLTHDDQRTLLDKLAQVKLEVEWAHPVEYIDYQEIHQGWTRSEQGFKPNKKAAARAAVIDEAISALQAAGHTFSK